MEISEYCHGTRRGCLRVPEGVKKAGWALLHLHLREYFLGKTTSRPGKEAVAGDGVSFNSTGNLKPKGWQNINEQNTESGRGFKF